MSYWGGGTLTLAASKATRVCVAAYCGGCTACLPKGVCICCIGLQEHVVTKERLCFLYMQRTCTQPVVRHQQQQQLTARRVSSYSGQPRPPRRGCCSSTQQKQHATCSRLYCGVEGTAAHTSFTNSTARPGTCAGRCAHTRASNQGVESGVCICRKVRQDKAGTCMLKLEGTQHTL